MIVVKSTSVPFTDTSSSDECPSGVRKRPGISRVERDEEEEVLSSRTCPRNRSNHSLVRSTLATRSLRLQAGLEIRAKSSLERQTAAVALLFNVQNRRRPIPQNAWIGSFHVTVFFSSSRRAAHRAVFLIRR